jgi:hypothetical protein
MYTTRFNIKMAQIFSAFAHISYDFDNKQWLFLRITAFLDFVHRPVF